MTKVTLSSQAQETLLALRGSKQAERLSKAIDSVAASPYKGSNVKSLSGVPGGFRKRVGRFRILYTYVPNELLVRIWIIDIEKDTKKDYRRWMEYILSQL